MPPNVGESVIIKIIMCPYWKIPIQVRLEESLGCSSGLFLWVALPARKTRASTRKLSPEDWISCNVYNFWGKRFWHHAGGKCWNVPPRPARSYQQQWDERFSSPASTLYLQYKTHDVLAARKYWLITSDIRRNHYCHCHTITITLISLNPTGFCCN